jgi:asparagine synthetase B (glutamine-hydrolysing)
MFLMALTRRPLTDRFASHRVLEHPCAPRVATLVTDGRDCRPYATDDGFGIEETLPGPAPDGERVALSRVGYRRADRCVELLRGTRAGLPLYYRCDPDGDFYCASHIGLLRQAGVPIRENASALPELFVYNYVSPPRTLYQGIAQVQSGGRVVAGIDDGTYRTTGPESLDLPTPARHGPPIEAACDATLELLERTFALLRPVAGRLAMLMSGGLDSSVLFRLAQRDLGVDTSYSTGFPFQSAYENVERDYAMSAAEAFGARHTYLAVTNEDFQRAIVRSIAVAEEPLLFIQPAMFLLMFARGLPPGKDIVVSGQGADALFGLATHHHLAWSDNRNPLLAVLARDPLLRLARAWLPDTLPNRRRLARLSHVNRLTRPLSDPRHVLWTFGSFGSEEWVSRHFGVRHEDIVEGRWRSVQPFADRSIYDLVSILAFFGEIPARKNIWSKLAQSEGRSVFYAYDDELLARHVFALPWELKLRDAKAVLQGVARRLDVPDFVIDRPKSGFAVRPRHVAEPGGILEPLVGLARDMFDPRELASMRHGVDGKTAHTFWNAINYAIWKRTCIDGESAEALIEQMAFAPPVAGEPRTVAATS